MARLGIAPPAALLAVVALALGGCGGGGILPYPIDGTGGLDVENSEVSTHWIDEMRLTLDELDDSDPFFDFGDDWAESLHNRDPNESEGFDGLTPGWWTVVIVWSDGRHTAYHDVHVRAGERANLEVEY